MCDPGLPVDIIEEILNLYSDTVPVFVDTVSQAYAAKLVDLIGKFHTAKPNLMETEILSEKINDRKDLYKACEKILDKGSEQDICKPWSRRLFIYGQRRKAHRKKAETC